jgi:hypothetical protein
MEENWRRYDARLSVNCLNKMKKTVRILGIRGVPAQHGGFETFAEHLSLYLLSKGWRVVVYCQEDGVGGVRVDNWNGVERVHFPTPGTGPLSTIRFDWTCVAHAAKQNDLCLVLGYNTAAFLFLLRLRGISSVINMDGIEYRRDKWGRLPKAWFWMNERLGCFLGNHLVADNPAIEDHLASRVDRKKITMIPYGANEISGADDRFLEMVAAFSARKRGHILVVLGKFEPQKNSYHRRVIDAASTEVIFLGAIYEARIVNALRYFARFYMHGHTVGGTNPSLVEAMGAGCAVIAHDNVFNRWVAGDSAEFFTDEQDCAQLFDQLLCNDARQLAMKNGSRSRFRERFEWKSVLAEYERLLERWTAKDYAGR